MKIIFLGTNGWYTTSTGNTPCILVDSKDYYVVLDAGNGIYKLDQYIKENKPIYLFISHFHIDHVSGLHTLDKFNFPKGLDIYIGEGRTKDFQTLVNPPFTIGIKKDPDNIANQNMDIRLHELGEQKPPFPAEAIEQHHAYRDHGYRIILEGKTIAYSGDCSITDASFKLAEDVDLLIHECSFKADHPENNWGHVGPVEAAALAEKSGVKKLILTHFDASKYLTLDMRQEAEKQAQDIFPNTTAAVDDMMINL